MAAAAGDERTGTPPAREVRPEMLTGWGRTSPSSGWLLRPGDAGELAHLLASAGGRGVIARGLGRSYGDAAQNGGGAVVDTTGLTRIVDVDLHEATVTAEAGVSLDRLMRALVPLGLWPAVSPGTRYVTVGGAIGSDIHGKGHHVDGTFGSHVRSMRLAAPDGELRTLTPGGNPEEFWATTGGMGLTGIVTEATFDMIRVETASIRVDTERTSDLDSTLAVLAERDRRHRYSVAWIDCLARGSSLGRSIAEFGDHALLDDLPPKRRYSSGALRFSPAGPLPAPPWAPAGLLNRWSVAAFNEVWYRKAPRRREGHVVGASSYFHPLDMVGGWNRVYGRRGFLQYQFVVPDGAEATLRWVLEQLAASRAASFLAVLKRFGPANPAPLSFPAPGWTLALDLPVPGRGADGLAELLDRVDERVVEAAGRIYLAKDSRLRPDLLEAMYPDLARWRQVRDRMDPDGVMRSDLQRRLPALGARRPPEDPARPEDPAQGGATDR